MSFVISYIAYSPPFHVFEQNLVWWCLVSEKNSIVVPTQRFLVTQRGRRLLHLNGKSHEHELQVWHAVFLLHPIHLFSQRWKMGWENVMKYGDILTDKHLGDFLGFHGDTLSDICPIIWWMGFYEKRGPLVKNRKIHWLDRIDLGPLRIYTPHIFRHIHESPSFGAWPNRSYLGGPNGESVKVRTGDHIAWSLNRRKRPADLIQPLANH